MVILHVAKENDYQNSFKEGCYGEFSIEKDGFIHCSTIENVVDVANDNLKNIQENLLILCIDTEKVDSPIKWELRGSKGIKFPHIYGIINLNCVIKTIPFFKDNTGNFYLPEELLQYKN